MSKNITLEEVFLATENLSFLSICEDTFYYLRALPEEQGRTILVAKTKKQVEKTIISSPYDLATLINGYGGRPYWIFDNLVYFSNKTDQHIYCMSLTSLSENQTIQRISPNIKDSVAMYADLQKLNSEYMACVVEISKKEIDNNITCIAMLDLKNTSNELSILAEGSDFYSNLVISADKKKIAWVQWDHPNMPWDDNELWIADIRMVDNKPSIENLQQINKIASSVSHLTFASNGLLFFCADFSTTHSSKISKENNYKNFSNIYCVNPIDIKTTIQQVTYLTHECGSAHWQHGNHRIVECNKNTLLCFSNSPAGDQLKRINTSDLSTSNIGNSSNYIKGLAANQQGLAAVIVATTNQSPQIFFISSQDKLVKLHRSVATNSNSPFLCSPQHIRYPTRDGGHSHGYFYAPIKQCNKPPLIVMIHGGPTSNAYPHYDIQKQFWISHGFAIFDVDHRGSVGYGRHYRDALYGHWGEMDIDDAVDGVNFLINRGLVDSNKICIRGKSAGGYAVLCALTKYPDVFQAAACYYGIGNLATLAKHTHKFEKYYTDLLIGETYTKSTHLNRNSLFYTRSPIHYVHQIKSPMIIFQGAEDKIVPPIVAREMTETLKTNNIKHQYFEYENEGHGFKLKDNNMHSLSEELNFYRQALM